MVDNSEDKGYLEILVKKTENGLELCEGSLLFINNNPEEKSLYVDFENGNISIMLSEDKKDIIGTYDTTPGRFGTGVYSYPSHRFIGRVSDEFIFFSRNGVDLNSKGIGIPDEECLASYRQVVQSAGIIDLVGLLSFQSAGRIIGNARFGAAAFIAIFYAYKIKGRFYDFFDMDKSAFDEKYASYLHPFG